MRGRKIININVGLSGQARQRPVCRTGPTKLMQHQQNNLFEVLMTGKASITSMIIPLRAIVPDFFINPAR